MTAQLSARTRSARSLSSPGDPMPWPQAVALVHEGLCLGQTLLSVDTREMFGRNARVAAERAQEALAAWSRPERLRVEMEWFGLRHVNRRPCYWILFVLLLMVDGDVSFTVFDRMRAPFDQWLDRNEIL